MFGSRLSWLYVAVLGAALLCTYHFLLADPSESSAKQQTNAAEKLSRADLGSTSRQQPPFAPPGGGQMHGGQSLAFKDSPVANGERQSTQAPQSSAWKAPLPEIDPSTRKMLIPPGNDEHPRLKLEGEARDVYWADVMEIALKNRQSVLEQVPGTSVKSAACRSTLCEMQLTTTAAASEFTNYAQLNRVLPVSEFSRVSTTILPDEKGGYIIFVYGARKVSEK